MNERIKELFEQAAKEFSAEHKYATFIVPNPLKEKFAELIVQECATVIEKNLFQGIGWNTSRAVKRHFGIGVEE
jgi:hypothetical protein